MNLIKATPLKKLIIKNKYGTLKRAKDYYENDKKRLRTQATDKYRNLSEEDQNEKQKYGRNRYHNMSEEKNETKKISKNLLSG